MGDVTPIPDELNRAGRRAAARQKGRLRKAGAALTAVPAAFGTTALLLGATAAPAGAVTLTVNSLDDTGDGNCEAAANECTLRDALDDANDGDVIDFSVSGTINVGNQLEVADAVTISGGGAITLDGGDNERIMNIDVSGGSKTVTISGLTFVNGSADTGSSGNDGGAIEVNGDEDLVVEASTFDSNYAYWDGGAIHVRESLSDLTISGSTFTDNEAQDGGAVAFRGNELAISSSTFTGNDANAEGGAVDIDDRSFAVATITGSTFTDNSAYFDGGAVRVSDGLNLTVTDSTFTGNTASDGGALYLGDADLETTIAGSTFTDNSGGFSGGAIALNDGLTLTVADSAFTGNTAGSDGGALYLDDSDLQVAITGSTFSGNSAHTDGGALALSDGRKLTIASSTFTGNTAEDDGGGLYLEDSDLQATVTGTTITGNTAAGGKYDYGDGGGIAADDLASLTISWSTIADNTAEDDGGGLYLDDGAVTIANTTISGNDAGSGGGGMFVSGDVRGGTSVFNSTISGNTAGGEGGGVYVGYADGYSAPLDLVQVTIADNTATTIGGVFIASEGRQSVEGAEPDDVAEPDEGEVKTDNDPEDVAATDVQATTIALEGQVVLNGTIVATNSGTDIGTNGEAVSTSSLIGTITGTTLTDQGGTILGEDPLLAALADNGGPTQTHALLPGSPAIDTGPVPVADFPDNDNDQRGPGYPRVVAGIVDIGAYEVQPIILPPEIVPTFTG